MVCLYELLSGLLVIQTCDASHHSLLQGDQHLNFMFFSVKFTLSWKDVSQMEMFCFHHVDPITGRVSLYRLLHSCQEGKRKSQNLLYLSLCQQKNKTIQGGTWPKANHPPSEEGNGGVPGPSPCAEPGRALVWVGLPCTCFCSLAGILRACQGSVGGRRRARLLRALQ